MILPERTRLRIVPKQKVFACSLCKELIDDPKDCEACPHCRAIFHYAHLAEYVKAIGSCPACKTELTFLPDLPRVGGSSLAPMDLSKITEKELTETSSTTTIDPIQDEGPAIDQEQQITTQGPQNPDENETGEAQLLQITTPPAIPQRAGRQWACIRCSQIKEDFYRGGFCKLCFRVVNKRLPTDEDLINPEELEWFGSMESQQGNAPAARSSRGRFCSQCGTRLSSASARFCPQCGTQQRSSPFKYCTKCGAELPFGHRGKLCSLCLKLEERRSRAPE
ncbi:MAG: zinc-ribbon domain-containing protein [Candidatus Hodarchaeota archaeon]